MIDRVSLTYLQPNKPIGIMPDGDMQLIQSGRIYNGRGSIDFRWMPTRPDTPGYYFTFRCKECSVNRGKATLHGENIGGDIDVDIHSIERAGDIVCERPLFGQVVYGDKNASIDNLAFFVPNFGFDPINRFILKHDRWEVMLKPFDNIFSLFEELDKEGGFAFTYKVYIRYDGGALFTLEQAKFIVEGLQTFLSFVRRAWIQPFFFNGTANGELIFSIHPNQLLGPKLPLTRWMREPLWCNNHQQQDLSNAFDHFMKIYKEAQLAVTEDEINEYEHLKVIIFEYIESGLTTFGETAIVLTQSALESLAYMQAEKSGKTFYESEKADYKIRWMLSEIGISVDIPREAKDLQYHLNVRRDIIQRPRDGPRAITYFRNAIVHPSPDRLIRPFGRATDKVPSEKAMEYAITLGRMYMELAILAMLNYKGNYRNPLNRLTQQLPLKAMALSQIAASPGE